MNTYNVASFYPDGKVSELSKDINTLEEAQLVAVNMSKNRLKVAIVYDTETGDVCELFINGVCFTTFHF